MATVVHWAGALRVIHYDTVNDLNSSKHSCLLLQTCNPWIDKCQQILFLLHPWKLTWNPKNHPIENKKSSSKPTCLGSMFIFRGFSTTFSRKTQTKTWATWHWRKHLAGSEHFGVGGGHVRIEFNWKCGDALGAAFGVSGRKSEGAKWWKHFWMVDGEVIKNHHRQRFAMKTNENENDDDRHHQIPYIFIYIYIIIIYIYIHVIVRIRHNKPWMNKGCWGRCLWNSMILPQASVLEEAWLVRYLSASGWPPRILVVLRWVGTKTPFQCF